MKRFFSALLIFLMLASAGFCEVIELPIDLSGGLEPQYTYQRGMTVYEDPSIRVEYTKVKNSETNYNATYYYAFITIASPTQLRTAPAKSFDLDTVSKVETMAKRCNAVLAINGDYYAARNKTYVLRQGVVYQDAVGDQSDVLLIDEDGDFHILLVKDHPETVDKTVWNGKRVINAFNFGPALIIDNEIVYSEEASPSMSDPEGHGQRMCIAQVGSLQYLVVTCSNSAGMTLPEMCELLLSLSDHIIAAYTLDGGNSAQMIFLGTKINITQNNVNVRKVSDIIYFASAYVADEE